ncbi:MAG: Uma2 family endonuclease [Nitrospirae bacterium]|nr:Uma2 family endonuclease [Nitrospirota bacterium]
MTMLKLQAWTYEDYLALPEGGPLRYEVIDGELYMTPAPNTRHQRIIGNIYLHFRTFLNHQPIGEVFLSPIDVILSLNPLQYVEPDLVFVSKERSFIVTERNIQGSPDIVVEILSEGTEKRDRREKFSLYERSGVPEYWIVDPEKEAIQIFQMSDGCYQAPLEFGKKDVLASSLLPGLSISLSEVF